ncbi:CvpA family protein [bacterium]|nr:CvpA family protein [bacterium]
MFNIADLIVVLIVAAMAFLGYKRGFVKTAFGMLSFIAALVLAVCFYKVVAAKLTENTGIDEWIYQTISGETREGETESTEPVSEENANTSWRETFANLPDKIKEELGVEEAKTQARSAVAEKAVGIGMNLISFVGIYVVARIVLIIVCFVLDSVMKIPGLKQMNEILGLAIGVLQGVASVFIVLAIIMSLSSFFNMEWLLAYIKGSLITDLLYENNFVISFLF